jgi:WD40 repeat protein
LKSTRVFTITAPTKLLGLSPDGRTLASTVDNKVVELRDATTGQVVRTLQPSGQFLDAAFSPDGRTLALTSADEIAVTLWDVTTGQSQRTLSGFQTAAPVYSVIFSPDGRTLIWIARAKVQLMDINSGQLGNAFEHEDFVSDTALTPDGRILATASAGTVNNKYVPFVKLWDAASGRGLGTLIHGDEYTTSIAFSPDGRILAAGSGKSVILWDVATQEELITLSGHTDRVSSVAFSPDGRTLASAGSDGTVRLWQVGR